MRLIDADALLENTHMILRVVATGEQYETVAYADDIDDAPTIDAVPVVHGHWVYKWNSFFKQTLPYCSVCETASPSVSETDYCPHCGAKMDEVTEDV